MKLGLGLYRHQLTRENFQFARQAGATHIVAHLVDYFRGQAAASRDDQPTGGNGGWGIAGRPDELWTYEDLRELRAAVESVGLKLEAIENFDPAHWYDVLLDGPRREQQIENVKTMIERVGRAGIPVIGYNFSLAGVAGRTTGPHGRGGALTVSTEGPVDDPIPLGMVWNMTYDENAPAGIVPTITHRELWRRVGRFLNDVLPTAERAGVRLAAHPDDPPFPMVRRQPRLVYQPRMYRELLNLNASPSNALELCIGSLAEMTEGDVYEVVDEYSRENRIGYIHFRNVRGKVPRYNETFIDDGDIDMGRVLAILHRNGFAGVLIPDHTPQMSCPAPWYAGMAYALGYMRAEFKRLGIAT